MSSMCFSEKQNNKHVPPAPALPVTLATATQQSFASFLQKRRSCLKA
jgi:hypothetical protein